MPSPRSSQRLDASRALLLATAVTFVVYFVPVLDVLAWPLLLVSTFVHELGHGLTALALGGQFRALSIWPDASGVAAYSGRFGSWQQALIAAGGLLGPPLGAALLFAAGRTAKGARLALLVSAAVALLVCAAFVRNAFGALFVAGLALALGIVGLRGSVRLSQFVTVFLAIQLSLSVFARADYLFMDRAITGSGTVVSDTAQISAALGLPYWFWGALIASASVLIVWLGLRAYVKAAR